MGELLGILGIVVTIGIAIWQVRRAQLAEKRLDDLLHGLPRQLARELPKLEAISTEATPAPALATDGGSSRGSFFDASCADVDGDGMDELLVQHPTGVHGSMIEVFGWRDFEFCKIGEIGAGTPVGFDIKDFDGDGRIEIGTDETDWSSDLPYALAPRVRIWYRWDGQDFKEVAHYRADTDKDLSPKMESEV